MEMFIVLRKVDYEVGNGCYEYDVEVVKSGVSKEEGMEEIKKLYEDELKCNSWEVIEDKYFNGEEYSVKIGGNCDVSVYVWMEEIIK